MKTRTFCGTGFVLGFLAAIAGAQGANDCANAQPISGEGSFPFDNTAANTDGPADCNGQPVRRDVWFDWTAPATASYKMQTCFGTSLSTRIAVYDGTGCPPTTQLVCSHGGCIDQTIVRFQAVMGQQYLLRVGSRFVGESGSGTFSIEIDPCPTTPDDGFEDNDDCASAAPIGDGGYVGLFVAKADVDWYELDIEAGGTLDLNVLFTHADGDIDVYLFDDCAGVAIAQAASGNDNEVMSFTNNSGSCQTYFLRVEHWLPDTNADCNNYDMTILGTGMCAPSGCLSYCVSTPNASGGAAVLTCTGAPNSSLELTSTPVPNTTGQFFFGPMMLAGGSALGDGARCVGGSLTRILPFVNAGMMMQLANTATIAVNYTAPYASGLTGTKYFQHWFRSGLSTGTGSNTSDALEISF